MGRRLTCWDCQSFDRRTLIGFTGRCHKLDTIVGHKDPACVFFARRRKDEARSPGRSDQDPQKEKDYDTSNAL